MIRKLLKRNIAKPKEGETLVSQRPGEIFPWPLGMELTAVDELTLALPKKLLDEGRPLETSVFGPDHMHVNIPPIGDTFFVRLSPGMTVSLARSCEAYLVGEDKKPRRIKVTRTVDRL